KSLELYFPASPAESGFGESVQAALRQVGIGLKYERLSFAKTDELMMANNYHIADLRWAVVDPSVLGIVYYSHNLATPKVFKFNWSRIQSPELDQLLRRADSAVDETRRNQVLRDIQKMIMDQAIMFPAFVQFQPIGYRTSVQGLRFAQGYWQILFY